ncbi:MCE family protein [Nocardia asteroides NBRC 15531]|uniref:Mce family protein n=1 Tax=Nocardia asteroides NBRC 15531 TaxID=1110697 RepID=U5E3M5_NOCAS|nr:MCE family protein [Nocardia asteroides]TLF65215.1 MCE family protein [Nocardia asteroides NBRC 15531]UGT48044.1 MCE family protein [Nocardia asteroides]SFM63205.1 phospholipid/cholesterol/gamma-HCH transport system substrate-binding protein [Nocardia asteroides]VEG33013.1 virulence factor Mce family protein [Nocardia asteroides]GAD82792.1 Mce family protein [Nocardia asteroides NBRC 15531]
MSMSQQVRGLPRWTIAVAVVVIVALVAVAVYLVTGAGKNKVTASFTSTTGLYAGDEVRVLGVTVGSIDSIEPGKGQVRVRMSIDSDVDLPADARAVIIAPSLVSARFVQIAPGYSGGPKLADGAQIPLERTAVPVEWDEIKAELTKLSTALGPVGDDKQGSFGRFVDTAAENLDGNGQKFRDTLRELSATMTTLSDGRTDLFGTIRNLQKFVEVLSASNEQIVQFSGRLASVSSVLAGASAELGAGLDSLDVALADVKRFLDGTGGELTEGVEKLADVTQTLVDKRPQIEQVLHSGPTAMVNFYQLYKPAQGSLTGAVALNNSASPLSFLCGSVRALENNNSDKSADLCAEFLAPVISSLAMNYVPIMTNPASGVTAFPDQLVYSDPSLEGAGQPNSAPAAAPITVPEGLAGLAVPGGHR